MREFGPSKVKILVYQNLKKGVYEALFFNSKTLIINIESAVDFINNYIKFADSPKPMGW